MTKVLVVLTQYKRAHLERQLESIYSQSLRPTYVVVFQNESHFDISGLKSKYNFIHIKSDYNTKYFGRFAACFTFPVDVCVVMDDDVIPGITFLNCYVNECLRLNSIIGINGRIAFINPRASSLREDNGDSAIRNKSVLMDFVGHGWVFKKEWLHYMFGVEPCTYNTGEDMHLCFSAKVLGGIQSYVGKQLCVTDVGDVTCGGLACDSHSSYLTTSPDTRKAVEQYFVDKLGIQFIDNNLEA